MAHLDEKNQKPYRIESYGRASVLYLGMAVAWFRPYLTVKVVPSCQATKVQLVLKTPCLTM